MIKSTIIPERMRRLMAPETRKEMKLPTSVEAQTKLDHKREKELQENIAALLRQRNIWFRRNRMDKRTTGPVGEPDFIFAISGKAFAFECKLPGREMTAEQRACRSAMMESGWSFHIVHTEAEAVYILNQSDSF